jgi:hypothetical protein
VFMNSWDVSGAFWSFSKCNITILHLPADPSSNIEGEAEGYTQYRIIWYPHGISRCVDQLKIMSR